MYEVEKAFCITQVPNFIQAADINTFILYVCVCVHTYVCMDIYVYYLRCREWLENGTDCAIFFIYLQAANIYKQEAKGEEKVEISVVKHVSYSKARQQQVKRVSIGITQLTRRLTSC